jgi:hypothetical protein
MMHQEMSSLSRLARRLQLDYLKGIELDCTLGPDLLPHDQTRPGKIPSPVLARSSSQRCRSPPSISMQFPHTPGPPAPPAPPAEANTLLRACLKRTLASFLCGAGASLARMAGSSIVGLPWDGGAPIEGGESAFSVCLGPFDSFVDVVLGEVWGGRRDSGSVGFNDTPRDGGLGGPTILALASGVSSSLFAGSGDAAELGGNTRGLFSLLVSLFRGRLRANSRLGAMLELTSMISCWMANRA